MMPLQSHRMGDVVELFATDFVQFFAFGLKLFVDLDGLLGHFLMRFLAAADEGEIRTGRKALVADGAQTDAEDDVPRLLLFGNVAHRPRITTKPRISRSKLGARQ